MKVNDVIDIDSKHDQITRALRPYGLPVKGYLALEFIECAPQPAGAIARSVGIRRIAMVKILPAGERVLAEARGTLDALGANDGS